VSSRKAIIFNHQGRKGLHGGREGKSILYFLILKCLPAMAGIKLSIAMGETHGKRSNTLGSRAGSQLEMESLCGRMETDFLNP